MVANCLFVLYNINKRITGALCSFEAPIILLRRNSLAKQIISRHCKPNEGFA